MTREMATREWVGNVAAILSVSAYIPLVIHITTTKITSGIHYGWLTIGLMAAILWFIYGVSNSLTPNIIASVMTATFLIYLTCIKIYYETTGKSKNEK